MVYWAMRVCVCVCMDGVAVEQGSRDRVGMRGRWQESLLLPFRRRSCPKYSPRVVLCGTTTTTTTTVTTTAAAAIIDIATSDTLNNIVVSTADSVTLTANVFTSADFTASAANAIVVVPPTHIVSFV